MSNLDQMLACAEDGALKSARSKQLEQQQAHVFVRAEFMECMVRLSWLKFIGRKDYEELSLPTAVYALCQEYIMARAVVWKTDKFSQSLVALDVVEWFSQHTSQLNQLFTAFSTRSSSSACSMSQSEFICFLESFQLLGPRLSKKTALALFAPSRDCVDDSTSGKLSYIEFAELIAALADALGDGKTSLRKNLDAFGKLIFQQ